MATQSQLSSAQVLALSEHALTRIVLDIHDGPVQYLFAALSLHAQLVEELEDAPFEQRELLERMGSLIESAMDEIRRSIGNLRLPEFQHRPLDAVIQGLVMQHENHTGNHVTLSVDSLPEQVPLHVKVGIYRVLQEALSNSYRHSGSEHHEVGLWYKDDGIGLSVSDQGRGFDPPALGTSTREKTSGHAEFETDSKANFATNSTTNFTTDDDGLTEAMDGTHIGLRGMRDRIQLLGGSFNIESQIGQGTHITVWIPIDGAQGPTERVSDDS